MAIDKLIVQKEVGWYFRFAIIASICTFNMANLGGYWPEAVYYSLHTAPRSSPSHYDGKLEAFRFCFHSGTPLVVASLACGVIELSKLFTERSKLEEDKAEKE